MSLEADVIKAYVTPMKLAYALCLSGLVNCLHCMAQQPAEQGGNPPPQQHSPSRQAKALNMRSIAPVPGLPVPMDLGQANSITLAALDVSVSLRQHQAFITYTCALDIPPGIKGDKIAIGVPFKYAALDERVNAASAEPLRNLPFSKAVEEISVGVNDIKCKYELFTGAHTQIASPVMGPLKGIGHWLVAHAPNKSGTHVLTICFAVPYVHTIAVNPNAGVNMGAPTLDIMLEPVMIWTGGPRKAVMKVYASEMVNTTVKPDPALDAKAVETTPTGVFIWSLLGDNGRPYAPVAQLSPMPAWQLNKNGMVTVKGEQGRLTADYEIAASSTLAKDPYGQPCSADNLKKANGYWAENQPGDGLGETLELTLNSPAPIIGIMLETGISPLAEAEEDTEARRHPNIAYSMFSRPKLLKVTLNDEYVFNATLRDDWTPQLIVPPAYDKPVKTIKIRIESVYRGTAGADTYMGIIKPVVK